VKVKVFGSIFYASGWVKVPYVTARRFVDKTFGSSTKALILICRQDVK